MEPKMNAGNMSDQRGSSEWSVSGASFGRSATRSELYVPMPRGCHDATSQWFRLVGVG
jgi:hypothetical protein